MRGVSIVLHIHNFLSFDKVHPAMHQIFKEIHNGDMYLKRESNGFPPKIHQINQTIKWIFAKNLVSVLAEDKGAKINYPHSLYVSEERSTKSLHYKVYFSLRFGLFVIPFFRLLFKIICDVSFFNCCFCFSFEIVLIAKRNAGMLNEFRYENGGQGGSAAYLFSAWLGRVWGSRLRRGSSTSTKRRTRGRRASCFSRWTQFTRRSQFSSTTGSRSVSPSSSSFMVRVG